MNLSSKVAIAIIVVATVICMKLVYNEYRFAVEGAMLDLMSTRLDNISK